MNLGSWKIDDLVTFPANTHNPTNGVATNADAVPSYHVYEDETPTPLITGTMSLLNNPNTIGFYTEQIQLLSASGFEKGKSYNIYIRAVVAGFTGTMSHAFQIEAEVDANTVSTPVGINTGTFLSALADSVWDELLSGHLTPGSAGHILFSRMPTGTVIVGVNQDKTGYFLGSPQVFDMFGNIDGDFTGGINGNVNGNVNGNLVGNVLGYVENVLNPVTAGNVTGSVFGNVNGSVNSVVQPVGINTGTFINSIADHVWDELISQHLQAGSTGEKLNAAGGAGDPWQTSLPGLYTPGQAGHILASRMPTGTVTVGDKTGYFLGTPQVYDRVGNTSGTFVGNIVGNLSGTVGQLLDVTSTLANKIADHTIRRTFANARASADGDTVSFRSLLGAIAKLVNKWTISGSTLTVYAEDDTTSLGTQALTSDASAEPITQIDTN
jgi:hypothetical protein